MFSLKWNMRRDISVNLESVVSMIFKGRNAEQILIRVIWSEEEKCQANRLIVDELLRDDPFCALDFDEDSTAYLKKWIKTYLDQNIAFGCFTYHGDRLVAVDFLYVSNIYDTSPLVTVKEHGAAFANFIKYVKMIERRIRYFYYRLKCNNLTSIGVFVLPEYRGIGIPNDMVRMRSVIAKTLRIIVIGAAFIGDEMQEAAEEYQYEVVQTLNGPDDMMEVGIDFHLNIQYPIKIMITRKYEIKTVYKKRRNR